MLPKPEGSIRSTHQAAPGTTHPANASRFHQRHPLRHLSQCNPSQASKVTNTSLLAAFAVRFLLLLLLLLLAPPLPLALGPGCRLGSRSLSLTRRCLSLTLPLGLGLLRFLLLLPALLLLALLVSLRFLLFLRLLLAFTFWLGCWLGRWFGLGGGLSAGLGCLLRRPLALLTLLLLPRLGFGLALGALGLALAVTLWTGRALLRY